MSRCPPSTDGGTPGAAHINTRDRRKVPSAGRSCVRSGPREGSAGVPALAIPGRAV